MNVMGSFSNAVNNDVTIVGDVFYWFLYWKYIFRFFSWDFYPAVLERAEKCLFTGSHIELWVFLLARQEKMFMFMFLAGRLSLIYAWSVVDMWSLCG